MTIQPLIEGVLAPILISLTGFLIIERVPFVKRYAAAVAVLIAFASAQVLLTGLPEIPPIEASGWLMLLLPAMLLTGALCGSMPRLARVLVFTVLLAGGLCGILWSMIEYTWESTAGAVIWIAGLSLLGGVTRLGLDGWLEAEQGARYPRWHIVGIFTLTSISLALSGSLLLAQLAGAFAAALGPLALLGRERVSLETAFSHQALALLAGLLSAGYFYAELPALTALFILMAVVAPLLPRGSQTDSRRRLSLLRLPSTVVSAMVALIPIIIRMS